MTHDTNSIQASLSVLITKRGLNKAKCLVQGMKQLPNGITFNFDDNNITHVTTGTKFTYENKTAVIHQLNELCRDIPAINYPPICKSTDTTPTR